MFNRKILKFSATLITLLSILNRYEVVATVNDLPICGNAADSDNPKSASAPCNLNEGGSITTNENFCINANKTEIYKKEAAACSKVDLGTTFFSTENYKAFECSGSECSGTLSYTNDVIVYKYDSSTKSISQVKNGEYFLNASKLLKCGGKGESNVASNGKCAPVSTGVFMNPDTLSTKTIASNPIVTVAKSVPTATTASFPDGSGKTYYLDEDSNDGSGNYSKIITCTSTTLCTSGTPEDGVYLDESTQASSYNKLIICENGICTNPDVSTAYAGFYLNPGVTSGKTKALIKCTESICSREDSTSTSTDNHFYIHHSGNLIKCTDTGCSIVNASTRGVYLDQGTESSGYVKVIKCTDEHTCSADDITLKNKDVFLNAAVASGVTKAIITCTESGDVKCTSTGDAAAGYYIDAETAGKSLISCTSTGTAGCSAVEGSIATGVGYISAAAAANIISFDISSSKFTSAAGYNSETTYYIDGSDSEKKKIIECPTNTSTPCANIEYSIGAGSTYKSFKGKGVFIICSSTKCSAEGVQPCSSVTSGKCYIEGPSKVLPDTEYCINTDKRIYLASGAVGACAAKPDTAGSLLLKAVDNKVGTDDVYIYKCDGNKICTQVIDPGYFDDGTDDLYINQGNNIFKSITTSGTNVYYLTKSNELVLCSASENTNCHTTTIATGFYLNSGVSGLTKKIISCNGTTCELINGRDGDTYLNKGANNSNVSTRLITCDSSTCQEAAATASKIYLDSGHTGKLIECNGSSVCEDNKPAYEGYYIISVSEATNFIYCENLSQNLKCSVVAHDGVENKPVYYLKGDSTITKLIKCDNAGCTEIANPLKGYYLTKDGALSCNGSTCKMEADATTCSKAGQTIKDGCGIKLCISTNNAESIELVSDNGNAVYPIYKTFTMASGSDFPGGNSAEKTITVKIDNDGRAFLLEEAKLPECTSATDCKNVANGAYCTYNDGGKLKIQKNNSNSCEPLGEETQEAVFGTGKPDAAGDHFGYFDDSNNAVYDEFIQEIPSKYPTMSYLCNFSGVGSFTLNGCTLVKGFTSISVTYGNVYCRGWKGDNCEKLDSIDDCTADIGIVGKDSNGSNSVCFKSEHVVLPDTAKKNVVFYNEEANEYYGAPGSQMVYLSMSETFSVVTDNKDFLSQNEGYQINRAVSNSLTNALLNCNSKNCIVQDAKEGYYLNGDNITKTAKKLIKCTKDDGCIYEAAVAKTYYLNAINSSKIIYCSAIDTCSEINHGATTYVPKHYLTNGTDKHVITCTPNGCFQEAEDIIGYFINGDTADTGKKLIKCNGAVKCELVDDINNYANTVGKLKVVESKVTMCIAVGCSGSGEVSIDSTNAPPIYQTIKLASNSDFPGASSTDISIKIGNDGSVILLKDVVTNTKDTSAKTFISTPSNGLMTSTEEGQKVYFFKFNGDDALIQDDITSDTQPTEDVVAYQCTYATSDNLKEDGTTAIIALQKPCTLVKGFVTLKNGNIVQCNGWRRDGCRLVTPKACAAGDEGKLGTGKKLCFGESNAVLLPPTTQKTPSYMAFVQEDINSYYGKEKSNVLTYLELTSSSVISIDPPATVNGNVVIDAKFIIQIDTEYKLYAYYPYDEHGSPNTVKYELDEHTIDVLGFKQIGSSNTYIHLTSLTADASTLIFACYKGLCKKTESYILADDGKVYSNVGSEIWQDKSNDTNLRVAACSEASQIKKIESASTFKICYKNASDTIGFGDKSNIYFFDEGNAKVMYRLGDGIVAIPKPDDGFYIIKNNIVLTDTTVGDLIECKSGKCAVVTSPAVGFYSNAIGLKIIKCSGDGTVTCALDDTASGYYIDNKNVLIFCNASHECVQSDKVGYFVNAGDTETNKYIECTKKKCGAIPEPETSVTCTEVNVGKLVKDDGTVKVCLSNGITVSYSNTGSYMVAYQTASIYKGFVSKNTYSGMLTVSATAIELKFDNTISNYCVNTSTQVASSKSGTCAEGTTEVICNVDGVCLSADATETLPDSIRNVKEVAESDEEESTNATDMKVECNVLNGKNCDETYYIVDKSNYSVIEDGVGTLFNCKRDGENMKCSEIFNVGYYIIDSTLGFYCREEANAISCSKLGDRIKTTETTCSAVGDIIFVSSINKLFFCQKASGNASTDAIELNSNNSGNYAIPKSEDLDIFGLQENQYALITIKDKIITLNNTYNNNLKYVYVNKNGKNKLIEKGDTCPKTTGASPTWDNNSIVELKECNNGKCNDNTPSPNA